ncbi:MAG: alkaline phosphatase family protein, partial [Deltaproteobacteria bacterium]|nr:alkaline phosphatase family protein [Deltaproteobacteria bacterium]
LADNCLVPFPTITPPNWATIATGAWAGTHGVTDFHYQNPDEPLNQVPLESFSSERVKAETIWNALDKIGKKCVVYNYPGAWPSKLKNGIMVGGSGLSIGETRIGLPRLNSHCTLCGSQLITTGLYPFSIRGQFQNAEGWENMPDVGEDPLDMEAALKFPAAIEKPAATTWYVLAQQNEDDEYDRITLSPTKDYNDAFCTLKVGEWSPKIMTRFKMPDGSEKEAFFRCKLMEFSDDAEDFRLLLSDFCATEGWTAPAEIAKELVFGEGVFGHSGGLPQLLLGWIDLETYTEINELHDEFNGDAVTTLLKDHEWDLFYMHSHPPDWLYHVTITQLDAELTKDKALYDQAWKAHLRIYQSQDRLIARIIEAAGPDTLVVLVSDHGATPDGPTLNPQQALVSAGLAKVNIEAGQDTEVAAELPAFGRQFGMKLAKAGRQTIVVEESKAIAQRSCYVYVNLKGRNPGGIVEPEDYEEVQQQIIDALLTYVDPETGKRPVALALTKKDARIIGLYGDNIGDVVYAINPWFGGQHGPILPTGEWGVGSLKGLLCLHGPGIKKGDRLQRTAWITDLVPTLCYIMNWPLPEQAEGAVLYQTFENPNFRYKA